jgi:hypothetical protein
MVGVRVLGRLETCRNVAFPDFFPGSGFKARDGKNLASLNMSIEPCFNIFYIIKYHILKKHIGVAPGCTFLLLGNKVLLPQCCFLIAMLCLFHHCRERKKLNKLEKVVF